MLSGCHLCAPTTHPSHSLRATQQYTSNHVPRAPAPRVPSLHALTHAQLAPTDNVHLSTSAATWEGCSELPALTCPRPRWAPLGTRFHFIRRLFHSLQGSCLSTCLHTHQPTLPPICENEDQNSPARGKPLTHVKPPHQAPMSCSMVSGPVAVATPSPAVSRCTVRGQPNQTGSFSDLKPPKFTRTRPRNAEGPLSRTRRECDGRGRGPLPR